MMSDAKTDDTTYTGFVRSLEDALQVVKAYELATKSRFVCIMRPRLFGRKGNLTYCCNIEHVCTVVKERTRCTWHNWSPMERLSNR